MKMNKIFKACFGIALSALLVVPTATQAYDIFEDYYGFHKVLAGMLVVGAFYGAFEYCRYWYNKRTEMPKPVNPISSFLSSHPTVSKVEPDKKSEKLAVDELHETIEGLKEFIEREKPQAQLQTISNQDSFESQEMPPPIPPKQKIHRVPGLEPHIPTPSKNICMKPVFGPEHFSRKVHFSDPLVQLSPAHIPTPNNTQLHSGDQRVTNLRGEWTWVLQADTTAKSAKQRHDFMVSCFTGQVHENIPVTCGKLESIGTTEARSLKARLERIAKERFIFMLAVPGRAFGLLQFLDQRYPNNTEAVSNQEQLQKDIKSLVDIREALAAIQDNEMLPRVNQMLGRLQRLTKIRAH